MGFKASRKETHEPVQHRSAGLAAYAPSRRTALMLEPSPREGVDHTTQCQGPGQESPMWPRRRRGAVGQARWPIIDRSTSVRPGPAGIAPSRSDGARSRRSCATGQGRPATGEQVATQGDRWGDDLKGAAATDSCARDVLRPRQNPIWSRAGRPGARLRRLAVLNAPTSSLQSGSGATTTATTDRTYATPYEPGVSNRYATPRALYETVCGCGPTTSGGRDVLPGSGAPEDRPTVVGVVSQSGVGADFCCSPRELGS